MKFQSLSRKLSVAVMLFIFLGSIFFAISPVSAAPDLGADKQTNKTTATTDAQYDSQVTCESAGGLGWVLCPLTRTVYGFFDFLSNDVLGDGLLRIDLDTDQSATTDTNAIHSSWRFFLGISNMLFVIAFLFIIYSMAIGGSISASYSVQKMLPRLVFAVIMAYLSAILVTFLIGLSNDIGEGVRGMMLKPVEGIPTLAFNNELIGGMTNGAGPAVDAVGNTFDALFTLGLTATGISLLALLGSVFTWGLFALAGLLLLIGVVLLRYLVVIMLFILAPIAFASFVLPNMRKFFSFWWESLWKALIMYPFIMLFIAVGRLSGTLIISDKGDNFIFVLLGLTAMFLPFFIIPTTFKLAGTALKTISAGINGFKTKAVGDPRDPTSIRSRVKRADQGRFARRVTGTADHNVIPQWGRTLIRRMPGVDADRSLVADLKEGRDIVDSFAKSNDELITAMALTAGGRLKGTRVMTKEGGQRWSARLRQGLNFEYNTDDTIRTDDSGIALVNDGTNIQPAGNSNFYSSDLMASVRNQATHRGMQQASFEHTMGKAGTQGDIDRVHEGIAGLPWALGPKIGAVKGAAAVAKGAMPHLKAGSAAGYFKTHAGNVSAGKRPASMEVSPVDSIGEMSGMATRFYSGVQAPAWSSLGESVKKLKVAPLDDSQRNAIHTQLRGIGMRSYSLIDSIRTGRPSTFINEDGDLEYAVGSQASPFSADAASKFYRTLIEEFPELGLPKHPDDIPRTTT